MMRLGIDGAELVSAEVFGNGKDCELRLSTRDPAGLVTLPLSRASLELTFPGPVHTEIFSSSEMALGVRYRPLHPVWIESVWVGGRERSDN